MMSAGSRIVNYEVLELIGSGSQGLVYLCRHTRLDRVDAVKVMLARLSDNAQARARFEREALHAARLQHVNVATIHDAGETEDGFLYVAMRYVVGPDLAKLIRAHEVSDPQRVYNIVEGLCSALDAAHAVGLVHRDVKPSNVLVEKDAFGDERAVLVDFGISKWWYETRSGTSTAMGTYSYLAPERIVGHAGDDRSDQYSLGCTTHECLTGKPPFPHHSPAQIVKAHLELAPPKVTEARPELSTAVDRVLARALAKNPMDRYPSCGAFAADLRDALGLAPEALPVPVSVAARAPSMTLPASVTAATSLTMPSLTRVAVEEKTMALGRSGVAQVPHLPSVPRQVSVISLVGLATVAAAYGVVVGTAGSAIGIGIAVDTVGVIVTQVGRRRGRRRNQRHRLTGIVVNVCAVLFIGVAYYLYPHSVMNFLHEVRGFGATVAGVVHLDGGQ